MRLANVSRKPRDGQPCASVNSRRGLSKVRWSLNLNSKTKPNRQTACTREIPCSKPLKDWRVLAFTIGLTLATSLLFGVVPALSAAGIHIQEALKSASLMHSDTRGAIRLRKT